VSAPLFDPPSHAFRFEITIYEQDLDVQGHVNNGAYLRWLDLRGRHDRPSPAHAHSDDPAFRPVPGPSSGRERRFLGLRVFCG